MALTAELLKQNAGLSSLTDEQLSIIAELSRNDENTVIGTRIGELHGQYDQDVLSVTGIAKRHGEKSYDYVKRILGDYKQKAESADVLNNEITSLKSQVEDYKKKISEGKGSEIMEQQLKDAQKQLSDTKELLDAKVKDWQKKYDNLNSQYQKSLIDAEFGKALQGIKFKSVYPDSVQKTLIESAERNILSTAKPDWVEENGVKKLVFRGPDGNIMTNPENRLNPFTPGELLKRELKEVLDTGVHKSGSGTQSTQGGGGGNTDVDLTGITNQVDADYAISKHLMSLGYTRGSNEFAEMSLKIRKENGVDKLPLQ